MLKILLIILSIVVAAAVICFLFVIIRNKIRKKRAKKMRENRQFYIPPIPRAPEQHEPKNPWSSYSEYASYANADEDFTVILGEEKPYVLFSEPLPESMACPAHDYDSASGVTVSQVQFSAVVPKTVNKGEFCSVDISVYEEQYREIVERIISSRTEEVKEIAGSSKAVESNTKIRIVLEANGISLSDCDETQVWQGKYLTYNFIAEIPEDYFKRQIIFVASVYFDGVIATKLKFVVNLCEENPEKINPERKDISSAFVSYSSLDRFIVATLIQGMRKSRPDLDIYCDIEKLHSGDNWQETLYNEIDRRDVLFLCWSENAKNSLQVEKEWRHALKTKGLSSIDPIPLVSPKECPPPEELKSKHFNDIALLYRNI